MKRREQNELSERFSLGCGDRRSADRGQLGLRRQNAVHLGSAARGKNKKAPPPKRGRALSPRKKEVGRRWRKKGGKSYRFSISWSRVIPEEGKVNEKGLQFYIDLVTELRSKGIEPLVTIFHWDLPVWVEKQGGWLSKKIIPLFVEYTRVVVEALSDKVTYWIPMNEPQCFIMNGYMTGAFAPFKHRYLALSKLTKICLTAHAQSVKTIRKYAKTPPKIGIAMAAGAFCPRTTLPKRRKKPTARPFLRTRHHGQPLVG